MENESTQAVAPPIECMPRTIRHAYTLQQAPASLPTPLTAPSAAVVARYLPESVPHEENPPPFVSDTRDWLSCSPELRPRSGSAGRPWSVAFGDAPGGLSVAERVLWPEMGVACARAVLWIAEYVRTRRFAAACELAGATFDTVSAWRMASPRFSLVYTAAETAVRSGRLARAEDTLHELANGDIVKTKQALTKDGDVVTLTESVPPDTKALSIALAAEDPARYGQAKAAALPAISIHISYAGVEWGKQAADVKIAPPAYDTDVIGADVTDTEEELDG